MHIVQSQRIDAIMNQWADNGSGYNATQYESYECNEDENYISDQFEIDPVHENQESTSNSL